MLNTSCFKYFAEIKHGFVGECQNQLVSGIYVSGGYTSAVGSVTAVLTVNAVCTVSSVFSILACGSCITFIAFCTVCADDLTEIFCVAVGIGYFKLAERIYFGFLNSDAVGTVLSVNTVSAVGSVTSVGTRYISEIKGGSACKGYFKIAAVYDYTFNSRSVLTVNTVMSCGSRIGRFFILSDAYFPSFYGVPNP